MKAIPCCCNPGRFRKLISILLSVAMITSVFILFSKADKVQADGVTVDLSQLTTDEVGEGYSYDSSTGVLTITSGPITLTSSGTIIRDKKIEVNGNRKQNETIDITFSGLIIDRTNAGKLPDSPFCILETNTSDVNITLVRANSLLSSHLQGTGLAKMDSTSTLTIDGTGRLEASGNVGIGALYKNSASDVSNLVINGGTITASGYHGAGIGSGIGGCANNLIINGGTINASSYYGCGVGTGSRWGDQTNHPGSTITINGGTIRASSSNGIGIGNTILGSGIITINGGDIEVEGRYTSIGYRDDSANAKAYININGGRIVSNGGDIKVRGGTITISGGTVLSTSLPLTYSADSLLILGGSCCDLIYNYIDTLGYSHSSIPQNPFNDSLTFHIYEGFTPNERVGGDLLYGMADYDYKMNDVYADEEGKIYLWLPESVTADTLATVTYMDGNKVVDSQLVIPGGTVPASTVLDQDTGFLGWYDSRLTTQFDFTSSINGDTTIYAKRENTTPTTDPNEKPTGNPTEKPTNKPTAVPTVKPTAKPTGTPTTAPSEPTVKPSNAPSNKPTAVPTVKPTTKPTGMPTTVPADSGESGVAGFVERLYSVALNRGSDPNGKADWINRITSGSTSGADAARGFFMSPEFINANHSDEEFLNRLYHTFFNREPDPEGYNNWLTQLKGGASRESILAGFINSTEWANLCLRYGIISGGTGVPNITINPSEQVIGFATRLYTTCLGREPDPHGLTDWSMQLANMQISGSACAHGFFFSPEFIEGNYSNDEYVTRLYHTFMNREPDPSGFADWVGQLNNGASRESVFQGFAQSQEWAGICAEFGILK